MAVTPRVGATVRFHFGSSVIEERHEFGQNIQTGALTGKVVGVFGKGGRFVKIACTKIGKDVVVDKEAIFAIMNQEKVLENSLKDLASKFNSGK